MTTRPSAHKDRFPYGRMEEQCLCSRVMVSGADLNYPIRRIHYCIAFDVSIGSSLWWSFDLRNNGQASVRHVYHKRTLSDTGFICFFIVVNPIISTLRAIRRYPPLPHDSQYPILRALILSYIPLDPEPYQPHQT